MPDPHRLPPALVVHGGADHTEDHTDGCVRAVDSVRSRLCDGEPAHAIAVDAVVALEADGRFNAGRGAESCLDGETFELAASVMDSEGLLGSVALLRDVLHPIRLALAVARETPHVLIAGEGGDRLARRLGHPCARFDRERARRHNGEVLDDLRRPEPLLPGADNGDFPRLWNHALPWEEAMRRHGHGTVGAVVRDAAGRFAVAVSTGGSPPALLGRVSDSAIVGSGFYCGSAGAICATGVGDAFTRRMLARTVHGWIESGMRLQDALDAGVAMVDDVPAGLIGVSATGQGSACNRSLPRAEEPARRSA